MSYRDPKPEELETEEFNAVWSCIKNWDIGLPYDINIDGGQLYSGATGNHVCAILDSLDIVSPEIVLGWCWAKACSLLDEGIDIRDYEISKLIEEFNKEIR